MMAAPRRAASEVCHLIHCVASILARKPVRCTCSLIMGGLAPVKLSVLALHVLDWTSRILSFVTTEAIDILFTQ